MVLPVKSIDLMPHRRDTGRFLSDSALDCMLQ